MVNFFGPTHRKWRENRHLRPEGLPTLGVVGTSPTPRKHRAPPSPSQARHGTLVNLVPHSCPGVPVRQVLLHTPSAVQKMKTILFNPVKLLLML